MTTATHLLGLWPWLSRNVGNASDMVLGMKLASGLIYIMFVFLTTITPEKIPNEPNVVPKPWWQQWTMGDMAFLILILGLTILWWEMVHVRLKLPRFTLLCENAFSSPSPPYWFKGYSKLYLLINIHHCPLPVADLSGTERAEHLRSLALWLL